MNRKNHFHHLHRLKILILNFEMHYFDHNATTPMSEIAKQTWLSAVEQYLGNPSSPHRLGNRAERALNEAREDLAERLGAKSRDIIWTSGATESSHMIFHHYAQTLGKEETIWVSEIEHPCVIEAAKKHLGKRVLRIPVSEKGEISLEWFEEKIKQKSPTLVVVMAANNETGVIQPWRSIRDWCQKNGVAYFCDAAQWLGKHSAKGLGDCDWIIGCAHKFGGPKGVGFLKCPSNIRLHPLFFGGAQEQSRRAGTENVASVLSMLAALNEREQCITIPWLENRLALRAFVQDELCIRLPSIRILGNTKKRLWNTLLLVMPDCACRFRWVVKLDRLGFAVSTGSACASGKEQSSHVLKAMGCSPEEASRTIRCSSGMETSKADWSLLIHALETLHQEAQTNA